MNIRLNKAHYPVTVLGPGRRIGVWVQGCSIGCTGCASRDTWDTEGGKDLPVDLLMKWCRDVSLNHLDGVTISGGEPFQQPEALGCLLDSLIGWRKEMAHSVDILCYSGLPYRVLQSRYPDLLGKLDAIIPEPFVAKRPMGGIWRGSDNQSLIPLSPLGMERYSQYVDQKEKEEKRFQIQVDPNRIWFIGIPFRGDMAAVEERCAEKGLLMGQTSWRA